MGHARGGEHFACSWRAPGGFRQKAQLASGEKNSQQRQKAPVDQGVKDQLSQDQSTTIAYLKDDDFDDEITGENS